MKKTIDCCHGCVKLLAGPTHSALGEFSGCGPTDDEIKWGAETMRQVAEYAATADVTIVVEYLNRFENYFSYKRCANCFFYWQSRSSKCSE